jgi:heme/copper-type cytochrome/quinol oxidase subunit 4
MYAQETLEGCCSVCLTIVCVWMVVERLCPFHNRNYVVLLKSARYYNLLTRYVTCFGKPVHLINTRAS